MKKSLMIIPLVILLCFTFSCQAYEEKPAVDIEADVEAIKSLSDEIMKAYNEGDLEVLMAIVAEDVVFMPPGEPTLIGKEAIRNWHDFDKISFDVNITVEEVQVLGDWAFMRDIWIGTVTQKESGEKFELNNKSLILLRRQPDGTWKMSYSMFNSNT
jgi:uncharacterized protein (TIGR02246 family)